jgi:hypothetical protein
MSEIQMSNVRIKAIRKAMDILVGGLYNISKELFIKANTALEDFRKKKCEELGVETYKESQEEVQVVVNSVLRDPDNITYIQRESIEIGKKAIRTVSLVPALEAWCNAKIYINKNGGKLQGVPIMGRDLDIYFKSYPQMAEMEEILLAATANVEARKEEVPVADSPVTVEIVEEGKDEAQ